MRDSLIPLRKFIKTPQGIVFLTSRAKHYAFAKTIEFPGTTVNVYEDALGSVCKYTFIGVKYRTPSFIYVGSPQIACGEWGLYIPLVDIQTLINHDDGSMIFVPSITRLNFDKACL